MCERIIVDAGASFKYLSTCLEQIPLFCLTEVIAGFARGEWKLVCRLFVETVSINFNAA
jgi:hypothetical protein